MRNRFFALLCVISAPFGCLASNEGVPSYYNNDTKSNANRVGYDKFQGYGYTKYVGNSGTKQVVSSQTYSYQVPRQNTTAQNYRGAMTAKGISVPEHNTTLYAGYSRRFADFQFKTGVNSILEWDDMVFNEINVGGQHIFDIRGFELGVHAEYTYGKMSHGGLSMDYDLEPYDYAYATDGIFTISMGDQSGKTDKLKVGVSAHHIWDVGGWKISPHIGYQIFKHDLQMANHIYPNPGIYLPLMTSDGFYVFGDTAGYYYAIPTDANVDDNSGLYQVCMGPEDIKVVSASTGGNINGVIYPIGTVLTTIDYNSSMGNLPWGVSGGECVVIGGDGIIRVDGTTHIYNTKWSGFYLGLEMEKQMTLADKLRFYVQVSMPKYSAEGTWPNRDDWQQNPSFLDEGSNGAFSYEAEMEYIYSISDRLQLSLKADTNYFKIGKIPGELYVAKTTIYTEDPNNPGNFIIEEIPAHTEYVSESLKEAVWQSFGLHLGLKYSF